VFLHTRCQLWELRTQTIKGIRAKLTRSHTKPTVQHSRHSCEKLHLSLASGFKETVQSFGLVCSVTRTYWSQGSGPSVGKEIQMTVSQFWSISIGRTAREVYNGIFENMNQICACLRTRKVFHQYSRGSVTNNSNYWMHIVASYG
jgi:hypothetical protein